jgi:prepilin-type N-terminal cleavage/methylation domain-containing protein
VIHKNNRLSFGFTLIELMIVVAIIGLLAAIALPKFSNLVVKSREASVKGKLGALRSALNIYYADNEGTYPWVDLASLSAGGKYLDAIPSISIPTVPIHVPSNIVSGYPDVADDSSFQGNGVAWKTNGSAFGTGTRASAVWVNCTHTDSGGRTWSLW